MKNNIKLATREIELDILRILAMLAVVIVHIGAGETYTLSHTDINWKILTFFGAVMTWQIPCFVMISGRFFLDPERSVTVKRMFNAIIRLCIAFVVWDLIYQIYYIMSGAYSDLNWKGIIMQTIEGPYHFWYIYMMIGVYFLIPFLRKITENKTLMEVFILLFLVFEFLTNYGPVLPVIGITINEVLGYASFHFALGYTGYFVAGYYFYKFSVSKRLEIILYVLGIILLFGAGALCVFTSINDSIGFNITSYLLPNVAIESFAIYTFFVKRVSKWKFKPFVKYVIEKISNYSSGIYYIHALSLILIERFGLSPTIFSPFIMVPMMTILVVTISGIVVWLIRKIPGLGIKIT